MLSAPRRSPGTPSPDGKLVVYTQSTYSFDTHSKTSEICVLDIANGQEACISKDSLASEPRWLGNGYDIVWLKGGENGNTSFIVSDASQPGKTYTAGTVPGPVSSMKLHVIESGMVAVAVAGQANPDGSLYNPKDEVKPLSSARIYDSLFVRHWDSYLTPQRSSIFTALLQRSQPKVTSRTGRYNLLGFTNALQGHKLESPIPTFGGTDHFDISSKGIAFVAKDPDLNPATHTKCDLYFVEKQDLMDMSIPEVHKIPVPGIDGAATSPVFSPDGKSIAFLKMKTDGYESDQNRIVLVTGLPENHTESKAGDIGASVRATELLSTTDGKHVWDRSASAVMWSTDGKSLLLQAEEAGEGCLFRLDLDKTPGPDWKPKKLTAGGYITDVAPLAWDSPMLFVSSNNLVDNSVYYIVDPSVYDVEREQDSGIIVVARRLALRLIPSAKSLQSGGLVQTITKYMAS